MLLLIFHLVVLCVLSALCGERKTKKRTGASFWQAQRAGPRLLAAVKKYALYFCDTIPDQGES